MELRPFFPQINPSPYSRSLALQTWVIFLSPLSLKPFLLLSLTPPVTLLCYYSFLILTVLCSALLGWWGFLVCFPLCVPFFDSSTFQSLHQIPSPFNFLLVGFIFLSNFSLPPCMFLCLSDLDWITGIYLFFFYLQKR